MTEYDWDRHFFVFFTFLWHYIEIFARDLDEALELELELASDTDTAMNLYGIST